MASSQLQEQVVGSLTAEGAIPPVEGLAGVGTQGCIGLQGAAQGQGVALGHTLTIHTADEAGLGRHHAVALEKGSWRMKQHTECCLGIEPCNYLFSFFICKKYFIYLFMRDTEREVER